VFYTMSCGLQTCHSFHEQFMKIITFQTGRLEKYSYIIPFQTGRSVSVVSISEVFRYNSLANLLTLIDSWGGWKAGYITFSVYIYKTLPSFLKLNSYFFPNFSSCDDRDSRNFLSHISSMGMKGLFPGEQCDGILVFSLFSVHSCFT
jgi:hypothetical protein